MSCRKQIKRIDQLLLGELTAGQWPRLAGHLHTCAQCAGYYNHSVLVLRQLAGAPDEVCAEELALIRAEVVRRARPVSFGWQWRAFGAALAVAVVVIGIALVRPRPGDEGQVQARGDGVLPKVSLRAYCVSEADPTRLEVVGSSDEGGRLKCRHDQLLQFGYRLDDNQPAWLYLAGVDASGTLLRYYPRPSESQSLRLQPASSEQPLPGSIRLSVRHPSGVVEVIGLVTSEPLTEAEGDSRVKRALGGDKQGGELRLTLEVLSAER